MPAPEGFNFDKPDQWPRWIRRFDRYREASGLAQQKDEKQIDTLIYSMGDKAEDILATFTLSEADSKKYPKVKAKFENHFIAKRNIIYERAKFNSRKQGEKEPIEAFITDLFALAEHCQYGALHDELIRDKIVVACRDGKLSEKLHLDPELTFDKAIRQARSSEAVKSQQEVVRNLNEEAAVHVINKRPQQRRRNKEKNTVKDSELFKKSATGQDARQKKKWPSFQSKRTCSRCGYDEYHPRSKCPAIAVRCAKCKMFGHFAKICRTKAVHVLAGEGDVDCQFLGTISLSKLSSPNPWRVKASLSGQELEFKIDSGADVTAIPEKEYSERLGAVETTQGDLLGPSRSPITVTGKFYSDIIVDNALTSQEIYVVPGLEEPLLGRAAIQDLKLLQVNPKVNMCSMYEKKREAKLNPHEEFPELFTGLGELKDDYKIELMDNAKPYALTTPRRIAIPQIPLVEQELKRMEAEGVISKVEKPTDWCCGIVVVPKPNGKIRICADLTKLNRSVKREQHIIPSVDHILGQLGSAKIMSKLDANSGYYQIVLHPESRELTTFITPFGRYCYNRLPFGITSACEIYQKRMSRIVESVPGVLCMIDDILVYGSTQEEHDQRLRLVLNRLKSEGVTLNKNKCEFSRTTLKFLGHVVGTDGLKLDPEKIKSILNFDQPKNITEVRRFLGMANQLGKFTPHLSNATKPLRDVIRSENQYIYMGSRPTKFV